MWGVVTLGSVAWLWRVVCDVDGCMIEEHWYGFKQRKNGQVFDSCHPLKVSVTSLSGLMTVLMYNLFFKKDL